jgi:hypothetical protein
VPDKEVEELTRQTTEPGKKAKAQVKNTTSTTMATIATKMKNQTKNESLTGLGTTQKKEAQKSKNAKTDKVPGNLVLPGNVEEATLLLEAVSRAANPSSGNQPTPLNSGSGGKVSTGGIIDDIQAKIKSFFSSQNSARDDAKDADPIKIQHMTPFSQANAASRSQAAQNHSRALDMKEQAMQQANENA